MKGSKLKVQRKIQIPDFVRIILQRLHGKGYHAYVVGGAVRDLCMGLPASDWDVATSAPPRKIKSIFRDMKSFSLKHETVTLVEGTHQHEVTSFRGSEGRGNTIEEDLSHRDFTINAMAYDAETGAIIDPHGGRKDISRKRVRAVGNPKDRFQEDPLRLMRAVRIATELGFKIEPKTFKTIVQMAAQLKRVAMERIREELTKILLSKKPSSGMDLLRKSGLLAMFLPELLEGYRKRQDPCHPCTIYRHILETVDLTEPDPVLRITALFHDIAKPRHREKGKGEFRFPGHEAGGASMAQEMMLRLKFSKGMIHEVTNLVRHHLPVAIYDAPLEEETLRRLVRRVGPDNVKNLLRFSRADLLAHGLSGRRRASLSALEKRALRVIQKPLTLETRQLAIDGEKVMKMFGLPPGPKIGKILEYLMERVTDHPEMNTRKKLIAMLEEMNVGSKS